MFVLFLALTFLAFFLDDRELFVEAHIGGLGYDISLWAKLDKDLSFCKGVTSSLQGYEKLSCSAKIWELNMNVGLASHVFKLMVR